MDDYAEKQWNAIQEDLKTSAKGLREPGDATTLNTEIAALQQTNASLSEALTDVQRMLQFEDRGWDKLFGGNPFGENDGMELDQVKETSKIIREYIVGSPIVKRASQLRTTYVWGKGVVIPDSEPNTATRGRKSNLVGFVGNPINQESLFSDSAHESMERAADSDGTFFLLGQDASKVVRPIPVHEIGGVYVHPDFPGEVWAYLREWQTFVNGKPEDRKLWYYTDRFTGTRAPAIIGEGGTSIKVAEGYTLFDQPFNRQVGWPLGIPGLVSAVAWAKIYAEFLKYGKAQAEALAKITFQVNPKNNNQVGNTAVKVAGMGGAGNTYVGENELKAVASAGKGYDFNSGRSLAAQVATAAEVSVIHLLSDPGAAGSSYGSAATLDLPTLRSVVARQAIWTGFLKRVLKWGTNADVDVRFLPVDEPDQYRQLQTDVLAWATGNIWPDEMRPKLLADLNIDSKHDTPPEGLLLPNNEKSLPRKDIDADGTPKQAGGAGQGQSNGTGGQNSNDQRTDLVSEVLNQINLDRLQSLVERLEIANQNSND